MTDFDMSVLDPHAQAQALAEALNTRGLATAVYSTCQHQLHPCVWAFSEKTECTEYIYVVPDNDGSLWFWFASTMEKITPAGQVSTAADTIAATLAPPKVRLIPVRAI